MTPALMVMSQVAMYGLSDGDQVVSSAIAPQTNVGPVENRLSKLAILLMGFGSAPWLPSSEILAVLLIPNVPSGMELLITIAKIALPLLPLARLPMAKAYWFVVPICAQPGSLMAASKVVLSGNVSVIIALLAVLKPVLV